MNSRQLIEWRKIIDYLRGLNARTVQRLHWQRAKHDPNERREQQPMRCALCHFVYTAECNADQHLKLQHPVMAMMLEDNL